MIYKYEAVKMAPVFEEAYKEAKEQTKINKKIYEEYYDACIDDETTEEFYRATIQYRQLTYEYCAYRNILLDLINGYEYEEGYEGTEEEESRMRELYACLKKEQEHGYMISFEQAVKKLKDIVAQGVTDVAMYRQSWKQYGLLLDADTHMLKTAGVNYDEQNRPITWEDAFPGEPAITAEDIIANDWKVATTETIFNID